MLIGQSPQITKIKKQIKEISKTNDHVLITGGFGTGKKYVAHEIHRKSKQKNRSFIIVNCTAIGDTITDDEFFGCISENAAGIERKIGLLEQADKGILYLENVLDLPAKYQQRLYNIIKESRLQKQGEKKPIPINLRIIAATTELSSNNIKTFRQDLLSLINSFIINLPMLDERKQDIPLLFTHFLGQYCEEYNREIPSVPAELFESLMENKWKGNILELKNAVKNLVLMSQEGTLSVEFLPFEVKQHPFESLVGKELPDAISEVEGYLIKRALQRFAGNQTKAAQVLNVSEAALRYKMKKYCLNRKTF